MIDYLWKRYLDYVDYIEWGFTLAWELFAILVRGTFTILVSIIGAPFALIGWVYENHTKVINK